MIADRVTGQRIDSDTGAVCRISNGNDDNDGNRMLSAQDVGDKKVAVLVLWWEQSAIWKRCGSRIIDLSARISICCGNKKISAVAATTLISDL